VLNSRWFMLVSTTLTLYALFFDDLRQVLLPKAADNYCYSFTLLTLIFFTTEIVMFSLAKGDYLWSFFFWVDTVQTVSLIFDIGWLFQQSGLLQLDAT